MSFFSFLQTKATWMLSNETRLRLAMAGNAGINLMMMIPENDVTTKMAYVQSKRSVDKIYLQQVMYSFYLHLFTYLKILYIF